MKKTLAIIFDLDGTLLNTDLLIRKSFDHVFKKYKPGYILSDEEHLSFLGPTLTSSFERYFPQSLSKELVECYSAYNHAHHQDYVTIYPTVQETLKILKEKGYSLSVFTTKRTDDAYIGLDLFNLRDYFDLILGMDCVKNVKPNPEGILHIMHQTNAQQAIMIGDNTSDILAGKNAGVYTIGVNWSPKGTKEVEALKPDMMINQMKEIIEFVERVS